MGVAYTQAPSLDEQHPPFFHIDSSDIFLDYLIVYLIDGTIPQAKNI